MSHVEDNFEKWIKEVMSIIIKDLGSDVDEAQYEFCGLKNYFMSTQYYMNVRFKNENGRSEELSVILKRPVQSERNRLMYRIDNQFHNEILLYQTYVQPGENFARYFHVDSVIALENVSTTRGYHSCPYAYDAPLEYILAALREMGRFHGKGYVMKERQRERFFDIVRQIRETRYDTTSEYNEFVNGTATRAVKYLRGRGHDATFCDEMEALLSEAFDKVMMKTVQPQEPLSTLCHGDFTLGNILFRSENDGRYRAMLIDFALCRYATPVVDLSTYLCVSCSNEMRKDKLLEMMRIYHDALKGYLTEAGISDIERYSYKALLDDYKRGGLFGFVIASFFLPLLKIKEDSDRDVQQILSMECLERVKLLNQLGGDEMSQILADMLLHLKDLGCLKYFR